MNTPILEIKKLTKYYGKTRGVENLSLKLERGEIFGFIGPNGAGKSTTIRCIMNLINKNTGEVLVDGKKFTRNNVAIKRKIGYLPSEIFLYDDLKVGEMLDYHQKFYPAQASTRRKELVRRFQLDQDKKIEDLSLGNSKKLGIILALMHSPEILILDEPTSGLDPIMQNTLQEILREEREKGTTVIYSTHILSEVAKICDRVGIIKNGKLVKIESIDDIINKNLGYITIESPENQKIIKDFKIKPVFQDDKTIKFTNELPYDELLQKLTKYHVEKLLVEEMDLENLFMRYYK